LAMFRLADLNRRGLIDHRPGGTGNPILLSRRQYGPALAALQKALDLRPGYTEAVWGCAQIHLWQGHPEQALKELARWWRSCRPACRKRSTSAPASTRRWAGRGMQSQTTGG